MSTTQKGPNLLDQWLFVQKVVSDRRLSRCAVSCAFHLVDYYNHRLGRAWPSYVTLAKLTGSNRRTVIEAVKRLIALGYFTVEKGNGRRSNYYQPNFALANKDSDQPEASDEEGTTPVVQTPPLQGIEVNPSAPNTSYIPVVPNEGDIEVSPRCAGSSALGAPSPSRGAPPGFEEFWQAYPKKEGRKAALTAYAMALRSGEVTPELLARKAAQYAEAKAANDPKWIKMPQYWLNDECWLEDPQPAKSKTNGASAGKPIAKASKSTAKRKRAKKTSRPAKAPCQPMGSAKDRVMRRLGMTVAKIKKAFNKRNANYGSSSDEELCRRIAAVYIVMGSPDLDHAVLMSPVPKYSEQNAAIDAMTWEDMAEHLGCKPGAVHRHSAKRRRTPPKGEPTAFGKNVVRYCEHLGITLEDLSLAMGLHRSRIEKYCYGRDKATTALKDQVKSLLIDAIRHPPENQPLTVEWLRDWYDITIKYESPKRYDWRTPRHYESAET